MIRPAKQVVMACVEAEGARKPRTRGDTGWMLRPKEFGAKLKEVCGDSRPTI